MKISLSLDILRSGYYYFSSILKNSLVYVYVNIHYWVEYYKNMTNWGKNVAMNKANILIPYEYEGYKYMIYTKPGLYSPILSALLVINSDNNDILNDFVSFFNHLRLDIVQTDNEMSVDISKFVRALAGPKGNFHGEQMNVKNLFLLMLSETKNNIEYFDDNLEYCTIKLKIYDEECNTKEYDLNDFIAL